MGSSEIKESEEKDNNYSNDQDVNINLQNINERRFMSSSRDGGTIWQSLMDKKPNGNLDNPNYHENEMNSFEFMDNMVSSTTLASDRMDTGNDLVNAFSVYPVYTVPPKQSKAGQMLNRRNNVPNGYTSFQSNLMPSIRDPLQQLTPVMNSANLNSKIMHRTQGRIPFGGGLHQVSRPIPPQPTRRTGFIGNRAHLGNKHMSAFLEPPPPRRSWSDTNGWKISSSNLLVPTGRSVGLDFQQSQHQGQHHPAQNIKNMVSVVVTPAPDNMPNTIPMNNVQSRIMHKSANRRVDNAQNTQPNINHPANSRMNGENSLQNIFNLHGMSTSANPPTFTAQQILQQQIINKQKAVENKNLKEDDESEIINSDGEQMVMQSSSDKNQFMRASSAQNQFWATISSRNKEALSDSSKKSDDIPSDNSERTGVKIVVSDADTKANRINYSSDAGEISYLANGPSHGNGNLPRPKLRFGPSTPSPMVMQSGNELSSQNQFMNQDVMSNAAQYNLQNNMVSPIQVNNPGSSGLHVVEARVPINQNSNSFSIGGSLVVGGNDNGALQSQPSSMSNAITVMDNRVIQPEIGVYPSGYDSNILHPKQVPTGTPLQQGPHGPIVPRPTPTNYQITQTPNVPQVLMHNRKSPNGPILIPSRLGTIGRRPHQNPGPGSYQPPITNTPNAMKGHPDSGQQLIKHYLMERNEKIKNHANYRPKNKHPIFQDHQRMNEVHGMRPSHEINSNRASSTIPPPTNFDVNQLQKNGNIAFGNDPSQGLHQTVMSAQAHSPGINRHGFYVEPRHPNRRQDPVSAAVAGAAIPAAAALGAISSSLTPVSIFSNLLNAYATLDSKHDITSRLVESASNWLTPDGQVVQASSDFGTTTEVSATSARNSNVIINQDITENQPQEEASRRSTTTTTEDYNENDPYKAIVVESDGLPPVRSNVGFSQPLRPKPPSAGVFRVTPSPNYYQTSPNYYQSSNHKIIQTPKYGINNPHYFTDKLDSSHSETAYGPDDFVVETVKLDKDFFHQFFTSKPLLLGTNVVTSTSVKTNSRGVTKKRGREASVDMPQVEFPVVNSSTFIKSKLHEMANYHSKKENRSNQNSYPFKLKTTTKRPTKPTTTAGTRKPSKAKNNIKIFKRYYIPPEVKISHNMNLPYN